MIGPYICDKCKKEYLTQRTLDQHKVEKHKEDEG